MSERAGVPADRVEFACSVGIDRARPVARAPPPVGLHSGAPQLLAPIGQVHDGRDYRLAPGPDLARVAHPDTRPGGAPGQGALFEGGGLVSRPGSRHARRLLPQARHGIINGSRIEALPGSEKTIRGFSGVGLLILDEAARVDDALYYAVRPMLAVSGGSLMMLTTPTAREACFSRSGKGATGTGSVTRCRQRVPADSARFPRRGAEGTPGAGLQARVRMQFRGDGGPGVQPRRRRSGFADDVAPLFGAERST